MVDPDRERGDALRRVHRHLLLPPLQDHAAGRRTGFPEPSVVVPLILLACLVATSVPMQLASRAARAGRLGATRCSSLVALVVQAGYLAYEVHDFADQLASDSGITRDAYSSIYYTLLGADHAHVALGLLLDLWLLAKLARGLTPYRLNAVAGDRVVLALRQRAHARRDRDPALGGDDACGGSSPAVGRPPRRGAASGRAAHVVGYGLTEAECGAGGARWGIQHDVWQGALISGRGVRCVLAAELAARHRDRRPRGGRATRAPPPPGRAPLLRDRRRSPRTRSS